MASRRSTEDRPGGAAPVAADVFALIEVSDTAHIEGLKVAGRPVLEPATLGDFVEIARSLGRHTFGAPTRYHVSVVAALLAPADDGMTADGRS